MPAAVRCPQCDQLSRIPDAALGESVLCPSCQFPFTAIEEELEIPTVYPPRHRTEFGEWGEESGDSGAQYDHKNVLFGLALLPFVIPLLWILGPTLTGKEAIFTFALPMSIAVSSSLLCLGIVLAADWSFATRVKSILAIVLVMHFCAGLLYFLKTEWVESIRRFVGRANEDRWVTFEPPDRRFSARVPSRMQDDDSTPIADWSLKTYRTVGANDPATYMVAHGRQPKELNEQPDDLFFSAAKEKATEAASGTLVSEKKIRLQGGRPGYEYVFQAAADQNTRRIIHVYRIERFAFVAAVEGAFLTPEAGDVKLFFDHLKWNSGK